MPLDILIVPTAGQNSSSVLVSSNAIGLGVFPKIRMGNYYCVHSKKQDKLERQISMSIFSSVLSKL